MPESLIESIARSGAFAALLCAVLYWLARHFLPERERQYRETLERIISANERALASLNTALERNSRILALNSQALLAQSFSRAGRGLLSRDELDALLQQIAAELQASAEALPESSGEKRAA